ncbi:Aldehyde/histidinol dehydrogenase [Penicillium camemberti]|uniref:aldehyde dehydrogenase (NAD(+)) n=1 Tax=Penicillium camemberti (strain FM 013) TaxID=1429867 RepID=A0A0G4NV45_PENC3|nr:Aldehyde/histidinol dehydrogenase [Penicillium camemberti]
MESILNESIETRLFINGEFRASSSSKTFKVVYPYTKQVVAQVQEADIQDVEDAVTAANAAFPAWRDLGTEKRGIYLRKLAQLILESNNELAKLETLSTGRPISQFFDTSVAADLFAYYAGGGWTAQGTASLNTPDHLNLTVKQPYGVVALIIPWNFPLVMLAGKLAPALAAGNAVVLKSSEKAPLTSLYVAKLVEKAGFPPGVVNIISGFGNPTGAALASHMTVRCISFTGSTATGQKIQAAAAGSNMKQVHMELGGKSPAIIFEDADLETAVVQTQFSIQFNSGQVCSANSRIYVHESVAKQFVKLFREKFAAVRMGDPLDPSTTHGPQIDLLQYNRIKEYLDIGEKDGTLSLGGDANDGFFVRPTIFEGVDEDSRLMQEEVFGPVVVINTFSTETEAIEKANNSEFGLHAAVFTKDIDRAIRLAKALGAGTVGVNCTSPTNAKDTGFGGFKMSGNGREGILYSLDSFLETKSILIKTARL